MPRATRTAIRRRLGRSARRTPATTQASYDDVRGRLAIAEFDEFVFGKPVSPDLVLSDGHIRWGSRTAVRRVEREHVAQVIAEACAGLDAPIVLELGCGNGANLLLLKRDHPNIRVIGLELSPVSVELAQRAAAAYGLEVEFHQADVSRPVTLDPEHSPHVVFSCHALEQMPDVFVGAVDNALRMAGHEAIFFEPVGECYPRNLRGIVGRLRLAAVDYLNGLHADLVVRGASVTSVRNLGFGLTPFNETVEIHVRTSGGSSAASSQPRR